MTASWYIKLALAVGFTSTCGWVSQPAGQGFLRSGVMKKCPRCRLLLPSSEFHKTLNRKDGLQYYCIRCQAEYNRLYRQTHREEEVKRHWRYRQNHKAQSRKYYQANKTKRKEYRRNYRKTHKAKIRKQIKQYAKTHSGVIQAVRIRRRARRFGGAMIDIFTNEEIFERDNWICGICGKEVDKDLKYPGRMCASLDHILPLSRGGNHTRDNVQLAHMKCNQIKSANIPKNSQQDSSHIVY